MEFPAIMRTLHDGGSARGRGLECAQWREGWATLLAVEQHRPAGLRLPCRVPSSGQPSTHYGSSSRGRGAVIVYGPVGWGEGHQQLTANTILPVEDVSDRSPNLTLAL